MVITVSQILIFICVIFFIIFNLIAVYLYQENYSYKKTEIKNPITTWQILSQIDIYKEWWEKFYAIDHVKNYVKVEESHGNSFFQIIITDLSKSVVEEKWTFIIESKENLKYLLVKKETITNSKFLNFMNKYLKNNTELKTFINNFKREQAYRLLSKQS